MTENPAKSAPESDPKSAPPARQTAQPAVVLPAMMVSVLVVAAAAGGALMTRDQWLPLVRGPQVQPPQSAQQAPMPDPAPRLAALEERLKALEDRPAIAAPTPPSGPSVDKAQMDDLARRLAESESRAADLARRLAAVEGARAQHARMDAAAQALILAVGQVYAQASAGLPFPKELDSLKALAAERRDIIPAVEAIAPIAATGAPTTAELRRRFETVARAAAIAARTGPGQDADWVARMKTRLFALVAIRRTDGAADGTPDALILAAENALAAGDVAAAIAAVEKLSPAVAAPAREWLDRARARVTLDAALSDMHARAIAVLAGGG